MRGPKHLRRRLLLLPIVGALVSTGLATSAFAATSTAMPAKQAVRASATTTTVSVQMGGLESAAPIHYSASGTLSGLVSVTSTHVGVFAQTASPNGGRLYLAMW